MQRWVERLKERSKSQVVILLLFGILLVVIAWPSDGAGVISDSADETDRQAEDTEAVEAAASGENTDFSTELESRLEQILSRVEGIGETRVMITLKSSGKKIVEKDTEQSEDREETSQEIDSSLTERVSSSESTVYEKDSQGNESPFVTEELVPEIQGILVIAQGADNSAIEAEITEAVMALFGVEAHKIKVMKME
ncbi:MAG: stage III sporulation protein AG [Lachnospiraceae bacterium]|nr:stage III sporulation protein AG [Lachnospiraceae bacterium]